MCVGVLVWCIVWSQAKVQSLAREVEKLLSKESKQASELSELDQLNKDLKASNQSLQCRHQEMSEDLRKSHDELQRSQKSVLGQVGSESDGQDIILQ
jgi:predicted Holliday junction resolvase-like endonuclease